ncbi:MAG: histone deacetylase family protein [Azospirillum sp.]|nr:histone deacetylase family protein [Azospirillum sp.]
MDLFYSADHVFQNGGAELNKGSLVPCFENPTRADIVLSAVQSAGIGTVQSAGDHGLEPLHRVHDPRYLEFLEHFWDEWSRAGRDWDALPAVCRPAAGRSGLIPTTIDGKLGYFAFGVDSPIVAGTWRAATAAVKVALSTVASAADRGEAAFGIARPPGHHAGPDYFGGYCFLNNAAAAAQDFLDRGCRRVAILDVDYHHGNGTQDIFYRRSDVLFVSIHADPRTAFPYYWGHGDETGAGPGEGANLNLPLPRGTQWPVYSEALGRAADRIARVHAEALVISLGLDTYEGDPLSGFRLQSEDFVRLGQGIAAMALPTAFLLEGGYAIDALGANAANVLRGYLGR